jgi:hypothetical protein
VLDPVSPFPAAPGSSVRIRRADTTVEPATVVPVASRIQRAVTTPSTSTTEVIRRVVESTQVGKRKVTKWYTTLDPNPINMTLFDTKEEAEKYERQLLAPKATTPTAKPAATTASKPPEKPAEKPVAKPAAVPTSAVKPVEKPVAKPSASTSKPAAASSPSSAKTPVVATTTGPAVAAAKPKVMTWEERWYAKQAEVVGALAPFVERFKALDPLSALRIRGSLASGYKGQHKALDTGERPLFNPDDFDIDAYLVSDALYLATLKEAGKTDDAAKGQVTGSSHPKVNEIIRDVRVALARIPGNRDNRDTWRFNIIIRSARNAKFKEGQDAGDLWKLGYDYAGFVGVLAPAKDTGTT